MAGFRCWIVALAGLVLSATAVSAQQSGNPCAGDVRKMCAGIQPGEGRLKACMTSHLAELSETCEARVLTVAVTGKVCKDDVAKLCAGIVPGTGGIRTCMKSNLAGLSAACQDGMAAAAGGRKILGRGDL